MLRSILKCGPYFVILSPPRLRPFREPCSILMFLCFHWASGQYILVVHISLVSWKHKLFLRFHSHHRAAAQSILQTKNFLLLSQQWTDRKSKPSSLSKISERWHQRCLATVHSKKKSDWLFPTPYKTGKIFF